MTEKEKKNFDVHYLKLSGEMLSFQATLDNLKEYVKQVAANTRRIEEENKQQNKHFAEESKQQNKQIAEVLVTTRIFFAACTAAISLVVAKMFSYI